MKHSTTTVLFCTFCMLQFMRLWTDVFGEHRIAICITGQLSRLELGSKLQRLVVPNLKLGFDVGLFFRLDVEKEVHLARKYAPSAF